MIADTTPILGLQLPHPDNDLADDVSRLRAALNQLDAIVSAKANPADITDAINDVVNAAPGALDTLNELAQALGDDPNFAATIAGQLTEINSQITSINGQISNLATVKADQSALNGEILARQSADANLQTQVNQNVTALKQLKVYAHFLAAN